MDLFFTLYISFLCFLKNLGFAGYVRLFLHSRYTVIRYYLHFGREVCENALMIEGTTLRPAGSASGSTFVQRLPAGL